MKPAPLLFAAVLAHSLFSPAPVLASPPQYSVTVLESLPGTTASWGLAINNYGQVTGHAIGPGGERGVFWPTSTPVDLGSGKWGMSINDLGIIAGTDYSGYLRGFLSDGTSSVTLFGQGNLQSLAYGINASNVVVGYSATGDPTEGRAAIWAGGGAPTLLGTLGGKDSLARDINDAGLVTGYARDNQTKYRAFLWDGTTMTNLGTLGGDSSYGYHINASGQVVGKADTSGGNAVHAVRWTGTTALDLGVLGNGRSSYGYGINDAGDVIGMSQTEDNMGEEVPFLYTGGTMYNLYDLLVPGSGVSALSFTNEGNAINNAGQIVVQGVYDGQIRAIVLSPVPEPSVALLLGGALWLLQRRRQPRSVSH